MGLEAVLGSGRPALRRVVLHGPVITDSVMARLIEACPKLEALWLSCASQVTARGLSTALMRGATCLRDLGLYGLPETSLPCSESAAAVVSRPLACLLVKDCAAEMPSLVACVAASGSQW